MFTRLYAMLLEAAYPGILEAIDAAQKEQDKAKQLGESQPNLPAEAVA